MNPWTLSKQLKHTCTSISWLVLADSSPAANSEATVGVGHTRPTSSGPGRSIRADKGSSAGQEIGGKSFEFGPRRDQSLSLVAAESKDKVKVRVEHSECLRVSSRSESNRPPSSTIPLHRSVPCAFDWSPCTLYSWRGCCDGLFFPPSPKCLSNLAIRSVDLFTLPLPGSRPISWQLIGRNSSSPAPQQNRIKLTSRASLKHSELPSWRYGNRI